ncbi:MAG: ribosome maturation factor RimP [Chlorobiaceae bacterium]|jgi:ribosome maturation factor RimP|nr:ribosome maturation factor RimP [Chlorobiaceae bacterium]NTV16306.1 ribosome maturation factor RimP [Chlorobiaceae bacterium]
MQERIKNCVSQVLAESVGTRGEGAYLIDIKVKGKGSGRKIEILMDADIGIRIHQCAWVSRRIRERIESDDELLELIGENFDLMVSSPGLGEPIILPRQYIRHVGKLLQVTYTDLNGEPVELTGHLQDVSLSEESGAYIVIMPQESKKRGQRQKMECITLYLNQVIRAVPEAEL